MFDKIIKIKNQVCSFLEHIIAPPVCYLCHSFIEQRSVVCDTCDLSLLPIAPKTIRVTSAYSLNIHAICRYDGLIKQLILAKHNSDHIAITRLADLMWQKTVLSHLKIDCLIPIPLHWSRALKRGFNQADIIAGQLASHSGIAVLDCLSRTKKQAIKLDWQKKREKIM